MFLLRKLLKLGSKNRSCLKGDWGKGRLLFPKMTALPHSNRFWKRISQFEKLWRIWASTIHGGKQDLFRKTQDTKQWLHRRFSCCWEQSWPSLLLYKAYSERCGNDSTWWQGKLNVVYISTLVILTCKQHMLIFSYYGSKYILCQKSRGSKGFNDWIWKVV